MPDFALGRDCSPCAEKAYSWSRKAKIKLITQIRALNLGKAWRLQFLGIWIHFLHQIPEQSDNTPPTQQDQPFHPRQPAHAVSSILGLSGWSVCTFSKHSEQIQFHAPGSSSCTRSISSFGKK